MNLNTTAYRILEDIKDYEGIESIRFDISGKEVIVLDLGITSEINRQIDQLGIRVAEASMGGSGEVKIDRNQINVKINKHPAIATMSCQLAGWSIRIDGKNKLGSGPARILAQKPKDVIDRIGYHEHSDRAALVLETDVLPDKKTCLEILEKTKSKELIIAAFRGDSRIGLINVISRVVETALFRLYNLGYDIKRVVSCEGTAPIPKLSEDVMFVSNDAIIYGGSVTLKTMDWDEKLTKKTVSNASKVYGRTFKEIFLEAGDFYKIDPDIFAPAKLTIIDLENGAKYPVGEINEEIIKGL